MPDNAHDLFEIMATTYALLPIGYPMGRFGPVRRVPLTEDVYENRWGQPYRDQ